MHTPCAYELGTEKPSNDLCWIIEQNTDDSKRQFAARLQNCESCDRYMQKNGPNVCAYRINEADQIVYVNNSWESFAEENGGIPSCSFSNIQDQSIWTQLSDDETRVIYRKVITKSRESGHLISFKIHCDSVDTVRILKATVIPLPQNWMELRFEITKEMERDPESVRHLSEENRGIITMCSYCGDLQDRQGNWKEIEEEISASDLFSKKQLPQISHGMCPDCKTSFLKSIHEIIP